MYDQTRGGCGIYMDSGGMTRLEVAVAFWIRNLTFGIILPNGS